MSTQAAVVSARAAQPDVTRAGSRASATPNAVAVLIAVVVNLIGHVRHLAPPSRDHARTPGADHARRFPGTGAIHRIGIGIRRAAQYAMPWHKAGTSLPTHPARDAANPAPHGTAAAANPAAVPPQWVQLRDVSNPHTRQAVANEPRRRTAGATLADICLPFPMTTESAGTSRDEWCVPTESLGGSPVQFSAEVDRRKAPASRIETPRFEVPPEHRRPNCLPAEEQLRDLLPPQAPSAGCSSPEAEPCTASGRTCAPADTAPAMRSPVVPPKAQEVAATPPL